MTNFVDRTKIYSILGFTGAVSFDELKPLLASLLAIVLDFAYSFAKKKIKDLKDKKDE
ncbi:hypothetical protein [Ornithobacterium rhinotracheale]|uniref:Uncharacterized protein n=1 Tax=Ornithobacterium rhinotracheale (strain ATCC 51463 / DSM 15997 / CCUG 23171 / CIP 104009 / LMG 9086) TaxID=867902 RepID=I3ZY18_ORNRL|nr:hypothetical protein [Ornithobacterium rhinotracheale]AFL96602.1 hypothetical protein Ornrh_0395 [Ornithobacterium rhinotracheale DSM 15997]AFL96643.1 hypothetical protein Ornrh_0436 [Ornithobacterium rhinotracheale DSM 15997]AFL96865.1 hypothetical protein Ornrh_0667 [Ornithobacterium rhinotracheale DSM 15997]AFL97239.1 hypothetical protein Ornrh_1048 [Ornithobacterium rhinotracheale DSM 15997]AFL97278.1 hypothetical protein Ornrh_1088 [Ornithobacterium rhinotracheale DSM 15997]